MSRQDKEIGKSLIRLVALVSLLMVGLSLVFGCTDHYQIYPECTIERGAVAVYMDPAAIDAIASALEYEELVPAETPEDGPAMAGRPGDPLDPLPRGLSNPAEEATAAGPGEDPPRAQAKGGQSGAGDQRGVQITVLIGQDVVLASEKESRGEVRARAAAAVNSPNAVAGTGEAPAAPPATPPLDPLKKPPATE